MRGRNYCWFFLLLIFSGVANASTVIYWTATNTSTRFASAQDACKSYLSTATYVAIYENYGKCVAAPNNNTYGYVTQASQVCQYGNTGLQCNASCNAPNYMSGGQCVMPACPVGQKRNASGQCAPEACPQVPGNSEVVYSPAQAKCVFHYNLADAEQCDYLGQRKTTTGDNQEVITADPDSMTQASDALMKCGFDITSKKCTTRADGLHKCLVEGTYNGQFNPAGKDNLDNCPTQDCNQPPATPKPEAPKPGTNTDSKPCNYASVNGALECTSSNVTEKEGTKNCGTFNGAWVCAKVPPNKTGTEIKTKVTTENTPDGGTKTTKTDTATQTKCTDIGQCVTKTTTTTTVILKDGQGNTTSATGSCTGDSCPDKNTNPDGDGDGFGDCIGGDCGDDATTKVGAQDWYQKGEDTYASVIGAFADRVAAMPITSGVANFLSLSPTGSCPIWQTSVQGFDIRIDQLCSSEIPWDLIRAVIIGCCAFLAFRIAFS